jgi:carboxymethylenebutenolidase
MPDVIVKGADGAEIAAYLARPSSAKGPAVVVLAESPNTNLTARCDALAAQGYLALAPVLTRTGEQRRADLQSAITYARKLDGCTGKVGALAFGGSLAYEAACFTDVDASVGYYPVGIETMVNDAGRISKWCLLHFAEDDALVPLDLQKKIYGALIGIIFYSIYSYKGVGHSFAREGAPTYDKAAADLANARTEKFLKENLQ